MPDEDDDEDDVDADEDDEDLDDDEDEYDRDDGDALVGENPEKVAADADPAGLPKRGCA